MSYLLSYSLSNYNDIYLTSSPDAIKMVGKIMEIWKKKEKAAKFIYYRWKVILSKRRLARLRICREIEHLPGLGIKYLESLQHFQQHVNPH